MRQPTKDMIFNVSIVEACDRLNLSARAVAALVEEGLLQAATTTPELDAVRLREDQVARLMGARLELARVRAAFPVRTPSYDRAIAWGALLPHLS